jgi:hypothetical protein
MPDFEAVAQDIQIQVSHPIGVVLTEVLHFCELFGTSIHIVHILWDLLDRDNLLPENSLPKHLLWALYVLKVYPKQSPGLSVNGTSAVVIDPKTIRKWV